MTPRRGDASGSRARCRLTGFILCLALLAPGAAFADALPECSYMSYPTSSSTYRYRVNIQSFMDEGWSYEETLHAVNRGADVWNQQSNGPGLFYAGATLQEDLPVITGSCPLADNLVVMNTHPLACSPGAHGEITYACNRTRWVITICQDQRWPDWDDQIGDLIQVLIHEFGHALGLDHSDDGPVAYESQMLGTATENGLNLFPYDQYCVERHPRPGRRDTRAYGHDLNTTTGSVSPYTTMLGGFDVARATPVVTVSGDEAITFAATDDDTDVAWSTDNLFSQSSVDVFTAYTPVVGPTHSAVPSSDPGGLRDALFFVRQVNCYARDATCSFAPVVRMLTSPSSSFSSLSYQTLQYCRTPGSSWTGHCRGTDLVASSQPISRAYDTFSGQWITAWARWHDHPRVTDRPVVAVGHMQSSTGRPQSSVVMNAQVPVDAIRAQAGPAVACGGAYSVAGYYDCMLAYVPTDDPQGRIHIQPFWVNNQNTPATVEWGSRLPAGPALQTSSPFALWHDGDEFWLVLKPQTGGQYPQVYSSDSGVSWQYERELRLPSLTGPTAVQTSDNEARILTVAR